MARPMSEAPLDPIRAARAHLRPERPRRFFKEASVEETEDGYALMLDGRAARTPGKNRLAARNQALMDQVAEEWARQGERLDPADMPLTRLLNSAIDGVARTMAETRAEILRYAGSDLLCYRAEAPETLAERQAEAFDPTLAWAARTLNSPLRVVVGVVHVQQPPQSIEALRRAVEAFDDPASLAGLSAMTSLTGSALLALATAHGFLGPREAWQAAHVDEDFQNELWGVDEEARVRREARWREMGAAAILAITQPPQPS
jgi:chaperone required for assembly of F1-ATPase